MSTHVSEDNTTTLTSEASLCQRRQQESLRREIAYSRNPDEAAEPSPMALWDLDALVEDRYTRTEIRRMQGLQLLNMLKHGIALPDVQHRLCLSEAVCERLLARTLVDKLGSMPPEVMRAISAAQYDWEIEISTKKFKETGKSEWMRERRESHRQRDKLMGLNFPERHEIETTQHIAVQFEVIRDREHLQRSIAEEQESTLQLKVANNMDPLLEDATDGTPPD